MYKQRDWLRVLKCWLLKKIDLLKQASHSHVIVLVVFDTIIYNLFCQSVYCSGHTLLLHVLGPTWTVQEATKCTQA